MSESQKSNSWLDGLSSFGSEIASVLNIRIADDSTSNDSISSPHSTPTPKQQSARRLMTRSTSSSLIETSASLLSPIASRLCADRSGVASERQASRQSRRDERRDESFNSVIQSLKAQHKHIHELIRKACSSNNISTDSPPLLEEEPPDDSSKSVKEVALYLTPDGRIPGMLTVCQAAVAFEPENNVGKYQALIDLKDIDECGAVTLPDIDMTEIFLVQLFVNTNASRECIKQRNPKPCLPNIKKVSSSVSMPSLKNGSENTDDQHPRHYSAKATSGCCVAFAVDNKVILKKLVEFIIQSVEEARKQFSSSTLTCLPFTSGSVLETILTNSNCDEINNRIRLPSPSVLVGECMKSNRTTSELYYSCEDNLETYSLCHKNESITLSAPLLILPEGAMTFLTDSLTSQLSGHLPPCLTFRNWRLVFCPKIHGISITTFYRLMEDVPSSVMVIEDSDGNVFGGFSSVTWHHSCRYYGTGEVFVFKCSPNSDSDNHSELDAYLNYIVSVYTWSCKNEFYQYSDDSIIALGGGGSYALVVDSEFLRGSTSGCKTFDSPALGPKQDFLIKNIQFFTFVD
eukprot:GHVL01024464.1.p2 GENE.GHVL01024464.1~~GHVL01024464.1.p2  ORF type:complete len:573 (+),score=77.35 GHVL01024464.1:2028-3746(+)